MILFTILVLIAVVLIIFAVFSLVIGGAGAIIIFSDVIVCVALIAGLICLISKKDRA